MFHLGWIVIKKIYIWPILWVYNISEHLPFPSFSIIKLPVVWPSFGPAGWPCAAHPSPCRAASSPVAAGAAPRWCWHSRPGLQPESPAAAALPPGTVTAPRCSYRRTDESRKEGMRDVEEDKMLFFMQLTLWQQMEPRGYECSRMWERMEQRRRA